MGYGPERAQSVSAGVDAGADLREPRGRPSGSTRGLPWSSRRIEPSPQRRWSTWAPPVRSSAYRGLRTPTVASWRSFRTRRNRFVRLWPDSGRWLAPENRGNPWQPARSQPIPSYWMTPLKPISSLGAVFDLSPDGQQMVLASTDYGPPGIYITDRLGDRPEADPTV